MQRMWRQLFAALAGVFAIAGAASAQSPAQYSIPQQLPSGTARVLPAVSPAHMAGAAVIPVGGQTYIRGSGGCNGCAAPCPTARDCNNGCGSLKSDCRFVLGSCKSFFDPCGPNGGHGRHGGCGGGLFGGHGDRCGTHTFGTPYGTGFNTCAYDSYLNH